MTREEAKELLPIIQAFAEGKEIQYRNSFNEWIDIKKNEGLSFIKTPLDYRIKPESQYRPFKSQEECWNEMLKHQPFGWIKYKNSKSKYHIHVLGYGYILINDADLSFSEAFDGCKFHDGTPFGIKEE